MSTDCSNHSAQGSGSLLSISSGIDWLSCSHPRGDVSDPLFAAGTRLLLRSEAAGNYRKDWSRNGLRGHIAGKVVRALSDTHTFIQVSGAEAHEAARDLIPLAQNVSRLDLQVTARYTPGGNPGVAHAAYQAEPPATRTGRPPRRELRQARDGGATCYLGARQSEVYGRVYDKGVEAGTDPPGTLWRWEVELKGDHARLTAHELHLIDTLEAEVAGWVRGHMEHWGVDCAHFSVGSLSSQIVVEDSDEQTQLAWLATGVQPSVQRLLSRGREREVYEALGLPPPPR